MEEIFFEYNEQSSNIQLYLNLRGGINRLDENYSIKNTTTDFLNSIALPSSSIYPFLYSSLRMALSSNKFVYLFIS